MAHKIFCDDIDIGMIRHKLIIILQQCNDKEKFNIIGKKVIESFVCLVQMRKKHPFFKKEIYEVKFVVLN